MREVTRALVGPEWRTLPWRALAAAGVLGLLTAAVPAVAGEPMDLVTLIAARPAGAPAPVNRVLNAGNGILELARPDGGRDLLRFAPDFRTPAALSAAGQTHHGLLLLVRQSAAGTVERVIRYPEPAPADERGRSGG